MERIYRDPLHNIIALSDSRDDDALIIGLIDAPEFQRLRHVKQLGLGLYTYQGAEHSRFTHSLGVMHVMTRALDLLGQRYEISPEARTVGRVSALLHDIGHGPFSHVIESVLGQHHEVWSARIIADEETEVHRKLSVFDGMLPARIIDTIQHRYRPAYIGELVSSQLDVDRFDYLLRDSLMTGAKYGIYDLEWILHALEIDEPNDRIYVAAKGLYAVEEYLQARYYMFRQVYFHRSLRTAEALLKSLLRRAIVVIREERLRFVVNDSVMARVLQGEELSTGEYLRFDDHDVMFHIKQWVREDDTILSDLARRFIDRRHFRAIDLDMTEDKRSEYIHRAKALVQGMGFDPEYYVIVDRAADIPYYSYYRPEGKGRLYVEHPGAGGEISDIGEVSDVVRGMRGYEIHRLCFPTEAAEAISRIQ